LNEQGDAFQTEKVHGLNRVKLPRGKGIVEVLKVKVDEGIDREKIERKATIR